MELDQCPNPMVSRKRKLREEDIDSSRFCMDEFNQDVLERVLSWLPAAAFFRCSSVCKGWKSVMGSASFKLACSQIPSRDPWFFMVDPNLNKSIVFDSAERCWRNLNHPPFLQQNSTPIPVAASGGLICFRNVSGNFIICNPITGSCRELPPLDPARQDQSIHAIAMNTYSKYHHSSYKLVLVSGELPKLTFEVYDSSTNCWKQEVTLSRKVDNSLELDAYSDDAVYFLSKAGNVVTANLQRSPSKQYSSVITTKNGEEIVYFLSSSGTVMACNLTGKCFYEYPRLLPVFSEYSIDLVECRGEMLVVVLSEFLESASLRVWRFDEETRSWQQIAAMPPAMAQEFYGKRVDINCVGAGDQILICSNSTEHFSYILCDLMENEWIELPKCSMNGEYVELMSAFSFEPRIDAFV